MRFGLCCLFNNESVSFRTTTAKTLSTLGRDEQLWKLSGICRHNAGSLLGAVEACQRLGIGAFRIMSPLFPRMTHPVVGYRLDDLPDGPEIRDLLENVMRFARRNDIRLSFHPDQFVVLSSPYSAVVENSIVELDYQAGLCAPI
jgi:UV DNA damage endonuclease